MEEVKDKTIYKISVSCRNGDIDATFVGKKEYINYMIEHEISIRYGEIWGKHSDVCIILRDSDIKMISDDPTVIKTFEDNKFESGDNPLYITFDPYDTEEFDEPENGIEWSDCVVIEWIEYKLYGTIPSFYKDSHDKWLNSQKEIKND